MSDPAKPLTDELAMIESGSPDFENFRRRILIYIVSVAAVFSLLFGILHDLDLNPLNDWHANVNYFYSAVSVLMLLFVWRKPEGFHHIVLPFLVASHLTFTSALWTVPEDQFRAIWFYLLILVAFMIGGSRMGYGFTLAALATVLVADTATDLQLTDISVVSIVVGLVILSLISNTFVTKATAYSQLIETQSRRFIRLAREDHLTGVLNARSFYEIGDELFKLARRDQTSLSILYLDIDYFKQVNDTFGHHNGDVVLQEVTRVIASAVRDSDVLARIGGEEFNVLLPETDGKGAKVLAEKIRILVEQTPVKLDDKEISVTLSIGVAILQESDSGFEILQQRADQLLYDAKSRGRNRVVA